MSSILALSAILILPFTALAALDSGPAEEAGSDRALDYISQVRDQREGKTAPSPAAQRQSRKEILDTLSPLLTTRDTPSGVVVTVPASDFEAGKLRPNTAEKVAQVAAMVVAHPGVKVVVEGYSETGNGADAQMNAQAVRDKLIDTGVAPETARAVGYVKARLAAYSTHADNGRVEIVISGPAIGGAAISAGQNYTLTAGQR
jgi:outer membrane protein OmpA-like peptidoglycan-associated protein